MAPNLQLIMQQLSHARHARSRLVCQMMHIERTVQFLEQQLLAATTARCPCCAFDSDCLISPISVAQDAVEDVSSIPVNNKHFDVVLSIHASLAASVTGDAARYHGDQAVALCKIRFAVGEQHVADMVDHGSMQGERQLVFTTLVEAVGVTATSKPCSTFEARYVEVYSIDAEMRHLWTALRQTCYQLRLYLQSPAGGSKQQSVVWGLLLDEQIGSVGGAGDGYATTKLFLIDV